MYDIGIVLINYNSSKYTIDCIASILEHTPSTLNFQIVVVDNASEADNYNVLERHIATLKFSHIKLIKSKINTGFGGGNMLGMQYISAKYIAFINNDCILYNDCLSPLQKFMEATPNAGVCGPQAFKENGDLLPTIDHFASAARTILKRKTLEKLNPKRYPKRKKQYDNPVKADYVAGSFMFFRTSDFNAIGGFDTNIFLYHEETDICKRLKKIGKHAYLMPHAHFMHYHGVSTGRSLAIKQELKLSLMYIMRKHYSYAEYALVHVYFLFSYFFKSLFKPKYWSLFFTFLIGAPLSKSLRHQQKINF